MTFKRLLLAGLALLVVLFAIQGGEFGTSDLLSQRSRRQRLMAEIDSLGKAVDSLQRVKRLIQSDPATQERIAREEFGMVRGTKEILYRFAEPGSESDTGRGRP
jgi:cell division protein FtsB